MQKKYKDNRMLPTQQSFGIFLGEAMLQMRKYLGERFQSESVGLRFEDWMSLLPIAESSGISQKELSERLVRDKTTVSRMIDLWVKKGWVLRKPSPNDKRMSQLFFTPKGNQLWQKGWPIIQEADQLFLSAFSSSEEKIFYQLVFQLRSIVEQKNTNKS